MKLLGIILMAQFSLLITLESFNPRTHAFFEDKKKLWNISLIGSSVLAIIGLNLL